MVNRKHGHLLNIFLDCRFRSKLYNFDQLLKAINEEII